MYHLVVFHNLYIQSGFTTPGTLLYYYFELMANLKLASSPHFSGVTVSYMYVATESCHIRGYDTHIHCTYKK